MQLKVFQKIREIKFCRQIKIQLRRKIETNLPIFFFFF